MADLPGMGALVALRSGSAPKGLGASDQALQSSAGSPSLTNNLGNLAPGSGQNYQSQADPMSQLVQMRSDLSSQLGGKGLLSPSFPGGSASTSVSSPALGGSGKSNAVLANAQTWLGVPYSYGGTSRSGVDCSGFTQQVFQSVGLNIGRDTSAQFKNGSPVGQDGNFNATMTAIQPGDLLFYGQPGASGPNAHVALYIGNGQVMQAPHSGTTVSVSPLYSAASSDEPFLGARRYV